MKKLITEINTILQDILIIYPRQNLLCTVSSGQDSILLFFVFLHIKNDWNFKLGLVYCNHFWQRRNFFSFWQIWKIAFLFDLPYFVVLTNQKLSTENEARNWRQTSLERVTVLQSFSQIVFGHTGSDKLETAFWNMIRGSSPNGLNGLQQINLTKRTFIQKFFSANSRKSFKPRKKNFQYKKQFFYRLNSRKKSFRLWSRPIIVFESCFLSQNFVLVTRFREKKPSFINKKLSCFYFGFLANIFITELQNYENLIEFLNLKKEKKYLNFPIYENFLFFSFCLKKMSVNPILKKSRPLITLHREDILKFTEYYFLPVIPDPTNTFSLFSRNKIRNQLLPVIRYLFSTNFDFAMTQFLKLLETESYDSEQSQQKIYQLFLKTVFLVDLQNKLVFFSDFLIFEKNLKKNKFIDLTSFEKKFFLSKLLRSHFQKLPNSLQSKIIKKIFFYYSLSQLNYAQIENLRFLLRTKKSFRKTILKKRRKNNLNKK